MSNIGFGDDDDDLFMAVDLDAIEAAATSSASSKQPQQNADNENAKRRKILSPKDESLNRESNNQRNSNHYSTSKPSQQTPWNATTATASELKETLSKFFGYPDFRPGQLEIVQAALKGRDVAVFMATGSGKSICYQIPALHNDTITFVVSPLISLMQDQVHKLNGLFGGNTVGNLATFLGSGQTDMTQEREALNGSFRLVYITPEKLLSAGFLDRLLTLHTSKRKIGLIAIDEAHCVSEWYVK